MKIVINPKYERLREWIIRLPETFTQQGEVIYDARNQIRLMQHEGYSLCVKRFRKPNLINRIVYTYFRAPKAERAYENAIRLQEAGISTPEPVAYLLTGQFGFGGESYLVCRKSKLTRNFYEFRHHPLAGDEDVVRAFARFTAMMHEKKILHKDYSPGNILFDHQPDGSVVFDIVDINRMAFDHPVHLRDACRNFCRLWGKEDFFVLLAQEYAKARGMNEEQCIRLTIKYWKRFWRFRK